MEKRFQLVDGWRVYQELDKSSPVLNDRSSSRRNLTDIILIFDTDFDVFVVWVPK